MEHRIDHVWYRLKKRSSRFSMASPLDVGVVQIDAGGISFVGSIYNLRIPKLKSIKTGAADGDFFNLWIIVTGEDNVEYCFADGGWSGWRGKFGGTKKLEARFRSCLNCAG